MIVSEHVVRLLGPQNRVAWLRAMRHERELFRDIEVAHGAGKLKKADFATIRYLNSFDAHLVAAVKAYRKMPRHQRPSLAAIPDCARNLDPWKVCDEEVVVSLKPKKSDPHDFRVIMAFGITHRARQYLVGRPLAARANLAPNQFFNRGGVTTAIREATEAMKNGYRYATEIDISNCFGSFDPDEIPNLLPLPKEVTRHTVLSHTLNIKLSNAYAFGPEFDTSDSNRAYLESMGVQWGIPQGSAISSYVAEMLLAPVIAQLPTSGVAVAYADNILVLGRTKAEMVSMTKSLLSALAAHPAGPLAPNPSLTYGPGNSVEFLGYRMTVVQDEIRIAPSVENFVSFERAFKRKLAYARKVPTPRTVARVRNFVLSWSSAFRLWDAVAEHRKKHLKVIHDLTS